MAVRERTIGNLLPGRLFLLDPTRLTAALRSAASVAHPLVAPFTAAWLCYAALVVLLQTRAFHIYDAGAIGSWPILRNFAGMVFPGALLEASRESRIGLLVLPLYVAIVCGALVSWCWACRVASRLTLRSAWPLVGLTAALALPVFVLPGLFSDDVYLYHLYGRTIATYGQNPIVMAPSAFSQDPFLHWVYWKDLPSAYGPLWLMVSAAISRLSGESLTAAVLGYRAVGLAVHLATTVAVWKVLRRVRPAEAVGGAIFYGWNPLVLVEAVGNAHNDVLVALFAVLLVAAATVHRWSVAAVFAACAVMVKPFAVLLLPGLGLLMLRRLRGASRLQHVAAATVAGLLAAAISSVPLWAGTALIRNIRTNPASHMYTNTVWELFSDLGRMWFGVQSVAIQHPWLDVIRVVVFGAGALWIVTRRWTRGGVAQTALPLWVLFYLTASWVWPWYFVPAIALAVFAGRGALGVAAALTAGGLMFWAFWPSPTPIEWMHVWRSLIMFGPLLAALSVPAVRRRLSGAFRVTVSRPDTRVDLTEAA
ncbi:MAG TPA: hypothetical protein VF147_13620 [Vicinamibacterales bacterium]